MDNIGHTRQRKSKTKHNMCLAPQIQANSNIVNMT